MDFVLLKLDTTDLKQFKCDMQEAFQKGFEAVYGKTAERILPEKDIDSSLYTEGAITYKAVSEGKTVGGAVVVIDDRTQHNHLDLHYVKYGTQSKGIGKMIWDSIESLHPETKVWETCTPYFDRRNIHFYVNKCGFYIVEYKPEVAVSGFIGDGGEGMFIFKKWMQGHGDYQS